MELGIGNTLRRLGANLASGLRLVALVRFRPERLRVDSDQLVLLLLFYFGLQIGADYLAVGPGARLSHYALAGHAMLLLASFLAAFLLGHFQRRPERVMDLLVALAAAAPYLGLLMDGYEHGLMHADLGPYRLQLLWTAVGILGLWQLLVILRAVHGVFAIRWRRAVVFTLVYGAIATGAVYLVPARDYWYRPSPPRPARAHVDVEDTYYAQAGLLQRAFARLAPQRPGIADLYFVGVGGDAEQDVFMREVGAVQRLFDRRFDTAGRSLLLVNNRKTVDRLPLANGHNLAAVLEHLGKVMDPRQDVLFLYLTSHGAPDDFAVEFPPLGLDDLSAEELRQMLDDAGIKWRVVVISACYSGSFIDALRGPNTLVITAAARDRTSFGCSNEAAFTYFGRAYFDQALRHDYSFTDAFQRAKTLVLAREKRRHYRPSEPQIAEGEAIKATLAGLQRRLAAIGCSGEKAAAGGQSDAAGACGETATPSPNH